MAKGAQIGFKFEPPHRNSSLCLQSGSLSQLIEYCCKVFLVNPGLVSLLKLFATFSRQNHFNRELANFFLGFSRRYVLTDNFSCGFEVFHI